MGALRKLESATNQGFFFLASRSGKITCISCAKDKMDETKGEIGDLRRLILVCQSLKSCKY